jgi:hypothetical protein
LQKKQNELETRVEHLYDVGNTINRKLSKILGIWDTAFKGLGIMLGLIMAGLITWAAAALYSIDGKWSFFLVVVFVIAYVLVALLFGYCAWKICESAVISKIDE